MAKKIIRGRHIHVLIQLINSKASNYNLMTGINGQPLWND